MTTTTKRQDFLGRWLTNATPGTSDATDSLGRSVTASNKDFVGRALTFNNPSAWVAATVYAAGDYVKPVAGGDDVFVALDAGTSHATTEPTWPALYATVVDNPGASQITWKRLY